MTIAERLNNVNSNINEGKSAIVSALNNIGFGNNIITDPNDSMTFNELSDYIRQCKLKYNTYEVIPFNSDNFSNLFNSSFTTYNGEDAVVGNFKGLESPRYFSVSTNKLNSKSRIYIIVEGYYVNNNDINPISLSLTINDTQVYNMGNNLIDDKTIKGYGIFTYQDNSTIKTLKFISNLNTNHEANIYLTKLHIFYNN